MFDYLAVKSYFNKWTKLSIGIDFGIGIDQNSWYRTGIVSKPKKLVSPITTACRDQRRNEGLPTMHCVSLLFTITIFNERLTKSC